MWKKSWVSIATEGVPMTEERQAAEGVSNCKLLQALEIYTDHEVSKTED